jgi:hypothetical protein
MIRFLLVLEQGNSDKSLTSVENGTSILIFLSMEPSWLSPPPLWRGQCVIGTM